MEAELEVKLRSELLRRGCHWLGSVPELLRPTDKNNKSRLIESFHLFVILFFFFFRERILQESSSSWILIWRNWTERCFEILSSSRCHPPMIDGRWHRLSDTLMDNPGFLRILWGFSEDSLRILWGFSEDSLRMLWGCYKISRSWLALLPFHRTSSRGRSRTRPL